MKKINFTLLVCLLLAGIFASPDFVTTKTAIL